MIIQEPAGKLDPAVGAAYAGDAAPLWYNRSLQHP
jgi:hypothetical protein